MPQPHMHPGTDETPDEVARRVAAFVRARDPSALWPGLAERDRVAAGRELARVTTRVFAGERGVALDPAGAHAPYALGVAGFTSGMGPVIGRWAEDGRVVGASTTLAPFARHLSHGRRRAARIEREVLPAIDALLAAGIVPVVLKGFHTARTYFEEPGVRRMADVDLLVPSARVADAERVLLGLGYAPGDAAHRPYKRDWMAPGVDAREWSVELTDERSRWMLELHASLDRAYHPGAVARLDGEREATVALDLAGRPLRALAPAPLLVSLACHGSQELDGSRLLRLVEIVRVARGGPGVPEVDWDAVLAMLGRTGAARYAYPALALAGALAPGSIDGRVLALGRRESTWAARHTVARLAPAGGSLEARGVLRQLMWTRGPVAIGQRVLRTVWPAGFLKPGDVGAGWRARLRRLRAGALTLGAPDERG